MVLLNPLNAAAALFLHVPKQVCKQQIDATGYIFKWKS